MNKQEIEENTDTEITRDGSLRELEPALIETARLLVKDDDVQAFVGDLSDPSIVMAIQLYQAAYEGMGTPHPTLAQLVEWLLEINADPEVYKLEDRLKMNGSRPFR